MNKSTISGLACLLLASQALAETVTTTQDIIVKANRLDRKDTETTYASEIHTEEMIRASGAATLYDYLSQQSSLNILPNYGNKATPSIDMRGYGAENGYQNIVVSIDGRRLNNIDMSPPLLSSIPLASIDRIEITKGSGSIIHGDGAMAGSIQIYTKSRTGVSINASAGNFGQLSGAFFAGITEEHFELTATATHDSHDGFSKKDVTNRRDKFTSNTQDIRIRLMPLDRLRLSLQGSSSRNDIRYVNAMTEAEFKADPRQVTRRPFSQTYTHQGFDTDQWSVGAEFDISDRLQLTALHHREDKRSEFVNFDSASDYDYLSSDVALKYNGERFSLIAGAQTFDGDRKAATSLTTKDNEALFLQAEYLPAWLTPDLTLSAGLRSEKVRYRYKPDTGTALKDEERLHAWDIGVNYRLNNDISLFANYNKAFQAPDVDRFFTWFGTFNEFIAPAEAKTVNIGLNHATAANRFKATIFHADIDNEIYFNPLTFSNTNIDRSKKYGIELQDHWKISDRLSTGVIYTYTRAIVERETSPGLLIRNKTLPGVPKHAISANLNYRFLDHGNINLSQVWRDSAYALNDFANSATQRQKRYASTNLAISYRYRNLEWYGSVSNIFEHRNALQVEDDAIYPVDFERTWRVGMRVDF